MNDLDLSGTEIELTVLAQDQFDALIADCDRCIIKNTATRTLRASGHFEARARVEAVAKWRQHPDGTYTRELAGAYLAITEPRPQSGLKGAYEISRWNIPLNLFWYVKANDNGKLHLPPSTKDTGVLKLRSRELCYPGMNRDRQAQTQRRREEREARVVIGRSLLHDSGCLTALSPRLIAKAGYSWTSSPAGRIETECKAQAMKATATKKAQRIARNSGPGLRRQLATKAGQSATL